MNATLVDNRSKTALSRLGNDSADSPATSRMSCSGNSGWAVVHTRSQAERWCAANLERVGYRVYLPMFAALVRDPVLHTRTLTALRPLFERYLFVHHDSPGFWRPIREAPGVAAVLNDGLKLRYASGASIEALQSGEASRRITHTTPSPTWTPGAACETVLGGNQRVGCVVISVRGRKAVVAAVMLGALREMTVPVESLRPRGE